MSFSLHCGEADVELLDDWWVQAVEVEQQHELVIETYQKTMNQISTQQCKIRWNGTKTNINRDARKQILWYFPSRFCISIKKYCITILLKLAEVNFWILFFVYIFGDPGSNLWIHMSIFFFFHFYIYMDILLFYLYIHTGIWFFLFIYSCEYFVCIFKKVLLWYCRSCM